MTAAVTNVRYEEFKPISFNLENRYKIVEIALRGLEMLVNAIIPYLNRSGLNRWVFKPIQEVEAPAPSKPVDVSTDKEVPPTRGWWFW